MSRKLNLLNIEKHQQTRINYCYAFYTHAYLPNFYINQIQIFTGNA